MQVGMPSIEDVISAGLDHKFAMAGYNARKYLSLAQEGVELGSYKGVVDQLGKVGNMPLASYRVCPSLGWLSCLTSGVVHELCAQSAVRRHKATACQPMLPSAPVCSPEPTRRSLTSLARLAGRAQAVPV